MTVDEKAWSLMVAEIGDAIHEVTGLAEALLPRYRERIETEDAQ